jgi:hypothetical protein
MERWVYIILWYFDSLYLFIYFILFLNYLINCLFISKFIHIYMLE